MKWFGDQEQPPGLQHHPQVAGRKGRGHVTVSPDHAGRGVAHGGVLGLDELLVVVDAAVDLVVLFACQLLSRGESPGDVLLRN